jgi:hypothetical protein
MRLYRGAAEIGNRGGARWGCEVMSGAGVPARAVDGAGTGDRGHQEIARRASSEAGSGGSPEAFCNSRKFFVG